MTGSSSGAKRSRRPGIRRGSIRDRVARPGGSRLGPENATAPQRFLVSPERKPLYHWLRFWHLTFRATPHPNQPRRARLLTGASRGIGHATVKRFSAAGWRVITCSRHPFPENCPWEMGPEDHIQVDLADPDRTLSAIADI